MTKVLIVLIWVYAILTLVPFIDSLHVDKNLICGNDMNWWPTQLAFQLTFLFSLLLPGCAMPLCCIAICYISIGISLNRQSKRRSFRPSHRTRQNRKTIKVLTSLVVVYAISILPHYIILAIAIFMPNRPLPFFYESHEFTRLMMTTNSCLNPIMYSAISKEFRDRMRYICCRRFMMRGNVNPVNVPVLRLNYLNPHHQL